MLTEFFLWLVQVNLKSLQSQMTTSSNLNDIIFAIYICSIKRSWHFALAFFVCDVISVGNYFGFLNDLPFDVYMLLFYLIMASVWAACIKERARQSNNKPLQAWCCIMITFLILMALDGFFNTYDETYIYTHYESIILCIHVCIVLSLYKPATIINSLVDKFRDFASVILHNYSFNFVWYTIKNKLNREKA